MITCFDAGHGGDDPGATYGPYVEKDIALTWVKLLGMQNDANWGDLGCSFFTRYDDFYPSWSARYEEAEDAHALLSVHVNAGGGRGIEIFHCSDAGKDLATAIMDTWPGEYKRGVKHDSQSQHGSLAILRNTKPPAVLIELGFIDNAFDMEILHDLGFGLEAADAVIQAVEDWHVGSD